jgi:CubicO group peptidase (beta-lactamase class C family)
MAEPIADIGPLLGKIRKARDLPALAAAVVHEGRTAAMGAVGVRKHGDKTPVTLADQFHLGSCTKSMTATLAGIFVEQQKLAWDSTLAKTLPGLASKMHADLQDVTLEQLLQHRSGLSDRSSPEGVTMGEFIGGEKFSGTPREQRLAYAAMILAEKPPNRPGSKYLYSNRNYALVGVMLETIADKPWEELMRERLFRPLGMTTAGFGPMGTPGKIDQPWQHRMFLGLHVPVEPGPTADNPATIAPAGTVHCSVGDWAKYVVCHVRGERADGAVTKGSLLKPETYRRLHTPPSGAEYAGGWIVTQRDWGGGTVLAHAGSNTQNYAVAWLAPRRDFGVLAMTNQGGYKAQAACDEACGRLIGEFLTS